MKKIFTVFILLLFSLSLWAQEESLPEPAAWQEADDTDDAPPPKKRYVMKNRVFELSLLNIDINFSNSFLAASYVVREPADMIDSGKFFKDSVSVNLNDFFRGFAFIFGAKVEPLSLNFNWKDKWGFGLDIAHITVTGNLLLSGNLLSFNEVKKDKFGLGAAVFADVSVPVFFHYDELKIKIKPSVFLPLVYTEPNVTYSYSHVDNPDTGVSGMKLEAKYDVRVYSVVDMSGLENNDMGAILQNLQDNAWDIAKNNLGYDISLGAEYPLYDWLDIGVDIINIPIVMANLNHYALLEGNAYFDASKINIDDLIDGNDLPPGVYGYEMGKPDFPSNGSKKVYRPFSMLFYAKCRPFESPVFSLIPSLGFSINPLYAEPGSVGGGLSARWDHANIFITTIGVNYNDRRWKNSFDFALNLRAFEIDLGISFQSPDFVKSFQGAGLGVGVGLKFGW